MLAMDADRHLARQRARNRALLALLLGVVALFYVMSLVKMGAF